MLACLLGFIESSVMRVFNFAQIRFAVPGLQFCNSDPEYLRGFRELKSRLDAERPQNSQHEIRRDVMRVPIENCRHASP
jgi:hypothetical protein